MSDETTTKQLLADRASAIEAGDAEGAIASVAEGSISFDLPPPLAIVHKHAQAIEGLREWFRTWNGPVRTEGLAPNILVSGDLAVAHGLMRMRGDKKGEGPTDLWFRSTVVLQRQRGAWRIVHEHNSVPLKMDGSGAAATDLKPE